MKAIAKEKTYAMAYAILSMGLDPVIDFCLCKAENILSRIDGLRATVHIKKIQTAGGLIQCFFVTVGIAKIAVSKLFDKCCCLCIIFFLTNYLFHKKFLLS